jgi:L-ectoine synthase
MIVRSIEDVKSLGRVVKCPKGGFTSNRFLLKPDGMGFGLNKTVIPENRTEVWHYKNHLEACYCISGKGIIINNETRESFNIEPDTMYALDKNESHTFMSITEVVLLCVFNPPLSGKEVHLDDGSYSLENDNV